MEYVSRQTYLYLALEETLEELGLTKHHGFISSVLLSLINRRFRDVIDSISNKDQKPDVPKTHMKAFITLDSEFLFGEKEHPKLKAVLYGIALPFG